MHITQLSGPLQDTSHHRPSPGHRDIGHNILVCDYPTKFSFSSSPTESLFQTPFFVTGSHLEAKAVFPGYFSRDLQRASLPVRTTEDHKAEGHFFTISEISLFLNVMMCVHVPLAVFPENIPSSFLYIHIYFKIYILHTWFTL